MSDLRQSATKNALLGALSSEDFNLLAPGLERIPVSSSDCFSRPGEPVEYVYFPEQGLASITIEADPRKVEVGLVGREGLG